MNRVFDRINFLYLGETLYSSILIILHYIMHTYYSFMGNKRQINTKWKRRTQKIINQKLEINIILNY